MDKNSPAPAQAQKAPSQPGAPTQQGALAPAQPAPVQPQAGAQRPAQLDPISDLKARVKADFGNEFATDAGFSTFNFYSKVSQGLRFRLERGKGIIKTKVWFISKKGGLLKPEFLSGEIKTGLKEVSVLNNVIKRQFLSLKQNDKTQLWEVANPEVSNNVVGTIKIVQNNDIRSVVYTQNGAEIGRLDFKCPVQKSGFCSSAKPATLLNIALSGKLAAVTFEENPNGEACQNDLEINAYYPTIPDQNGFVALVAMLTALARELQ